MTHKTETGVDDAKEAPSAANNRLGLGFPIAMAGGAVMGFFGVALFVHDPSRPQLIYGWIGGMAAVIILKLTQESEA